ncbi:TIGR01620 family protein [Marinobacterium maritimum]|uniref:TIGR01620 family protein n=1 Tax=Marinobacterium maritimum TaxID=500162 RepID=A0ABP3TD10_9GAMM
MSSKENWQRPVELAPEDLSSGDQSDTSQPSAARPNAARPNAAQPNAAREIPLEMTHAVDDAEPVIPPPQPPERHRSRRWLWGSLGALVIAAFGAELYRLLNWSSNLHPLLGMTFGLLTLVLLGALGLEIRRGLKGSRQLKQVRLLQHEALALQEQSTHGNSTRLTRQLERQYRHSSLNRELQGALQQLDSSYNDGEIIHYLNRHALTQADEAAQACVQRYSIESGVLVAFSPWASFDMLLVAWRNLRMLREISTIYGVAPGLLTQGRLLKQVLQNLAFAGASEMAMEAGSALLSSSVTASLSARAGQGLGAGLFTARTGLTAITLCRPLPDPRQSTGMLSKIAKGIMQRLASRT